MASPESRDRRISQGYQALRLYVRWFWVISATCLLMFVVGNTEIRAPFLESRIQSALQMIEPNTTFSTEDVFIQIVPWRGQVRARLSKTRLLYDDIVNAPLDLEDLRFDVPVHRLIRGDIRPSGLAVRGTRLQITLNDDIAALIPRPGERRSTEETWGFVFDPTWIAALERALPLYIFSQVYIEGVSISVTNASGTLPLFTLKIDQGFADTPLGFSTGLRGRNAQLAGQLMAPGGQTTAFIFESSLQSSGQLQGAIQIETAVPAHFHNILRIAGLATPERLTTAYTLGASFDFNPREGWQSANIEVTEVRDSIDNAVLIVDTTANRQSQQFELKGRFFGIDLRRIAPWTAVPEFMEDLALTTNGTFGFRWNRYSDEWFGSFNLTGGEGMLAIPSIGLPSQVGAAVGVRDIRAQGSFDSSGISLTDMVVVTGSNKQTGPTLNADLVVRGTPIGRIMTLDLRSQKLNQGDLFFLWPERVATKSRSEIKNFVTAGAFADLSFTGIYRLVAGPEGRTRFELEGQQLYADFRDAQVRLTPDLPPLSQASGRLSMVRERLEIDVDRANLDAMTLTSGRTVLDFSQPDWVELTVDSPISGPLAPALTILAEGNLGLEGLSSLPIEQTRGTALGTLTFGLAFNPKTVGQQGINYDDIDVDTQLQISQLQVSDFLVGDGIQDGRLVLNIREEGLSGYGQVRLDGLEGSVEIAQSYGPRQPYVLEVKTKLLVPAPKIGRFVPGLETFLSGQAGGEFLYRSEENKPATLSVDLDLVDLGIDFKSLGYSKSPGDSGRLTMNLIFGAKNPEYVENLRIRAPNLRFDANIDLKITSWDSVEATSMQIGQTDLTDLRIENRENHIWAHFRDGHWTLAPVLEEFRNPPKGENAERGFGLGFSLSKPLIIENAFLNRLYFTEKGYVTDAILSVVLANNGLRGYTLNAAVPDNGPDFPGGQMDSRLVKRQGGDETYALSLQADNLGALLNALGISNQVFGGRFALSGESPFPLGGGPWTVQGEISSELEIKEVSPLVNVLSLISLTGILEQMLGSGLIISDFDFTAILNATGMKINDFKFGGPSLGLTLTGDLDWSKGVLDIRGALAPFNLVNLLVGGIPLLGGIITGTEKEGLIATQFSIQGSMEDPDFDVDTLSTFQPGLLRSIIDGIQRN